METQKTISQWGIETFGTPVTNEVIFDRFIEEINELASSYDERMAGKIQDKCADVFIVLCQFCEQSGFDLMTIVNDKMAINRARKWSTDGDGVSQYIED